MHPSTGVSTNLVCVKYFEYLSKPSQLSHAYSRMGAGGAAERVAATVGTIGRVWTGEASA